MPFRCASRILEDLLGVSVRSESARWLGEQVGKRVEDVHTAEANRPWKADPAMRRTPFAWREARMERWFR
jgi:hypothetical protein